MQKVSSFFFANSSCKRSATRLLKGWHLQQSKVAPCLAGGCYSDSGLSGLSVATGLELDGLLGVESVGSVESSELSESKLLISTVLVSETLYSLGGVSDLSADVANRLAWLSLGDGSSLGDTVLLLGLEGEGEHSSEGSLLGVLGLLASRDTDGSGGLGGVPHTGHGVWALGPLASVPLNELVVPFLGEAPHNLWRSVSHLTCKKTTRIRTLSISQTSFVPIGSLAFLPSTILVRERFHSKPRDLSISTYLLRLIN